MSTIRFFLTALIVLTTGAAVAHADDDMSLLVTGGYMAPRGGIAEAAGGGAELRLHDDHLTVGLGATALVGRAPATRRRDLMDVRADIGLRLCERCEHVTPYVGIGLDVLHVTTHEGTRSFRGSTLGLSGHVGLLGEMDDGKWTWRMGVSYLGAIVPGSGEDLGGVTLSVGFGKQIMD